MHRPPSVHFASTGKKVQPSTGSQLSTVQSMWSSQVTGVPRQKPSEQVSPLVQASPSSQQRPSSAPQAHAAPLGTQSSGVAAARRASRGAAPPPHCSGVQVLLQPSPL